MDNDSEELKNKLTLSECVKNAFNHDTLIAGKNFGIKGWLYSGQVKIPCFVCKNDLESFNCFYKSQKKGKSYHWALFCKCCKTTVVPSKLDIEQRKLLYSCVKPTSEIPAAKPFVSDPTEKKDKEVLDNIYVIMRKMRASRKDPDTEDSVSLVYKVVNIMLSTSSGDSISNQAKLGMNQVKGVGL